MPTLRVWRKSLVKEHSSTSLISGAYLSQPCLRKRGNVDGRGKEGLWEWRVNRGKVIYTFSERKKNGEVKESHTGCERQSVMLVLLV